MEQQQGADLGTIDLGSLEICNGGVSNGFVFQENEDLYVEKARKQKEFREKNTKLPTSCPAGRSYYHALHEDEVDEEE